MMHFPKGGNWQDWAGSAHSRNLEWHNRPKELIEWQKQDREGLSDRWLQIVEGRVGWCWSKPRQQGLSVERIVHNIYHDEPRRIALKKDYGYGKKRKHRSLTRDLSFFHFQSDRITFIRYAL